ncbi:MAG: metallophosphoesterase [Candidatus Solibacter usitatus]|nr:metallophosphoesterase [Candidatus Solibacter usitatus]
MGFFFGRTAETIVYLIMAFAQWRMGRAILDWTAKSGWVPVNVVRRVLIACAAIILFGILISYHTIAAWNPLDYKIGGGVRAAVYLWGCGSTGGWVIYQFLRLTKVWPDEIPPAPQNPARRRLLLAAGSAAIASPFAVLGWGTFLERTNFRIREIDVTIAGLPDDLAGLRLVQLSDIHLSAFLSAAEFARVIDAANELRPHVAVVTGDLISMHGDPLDACLDQLARLRAEAGVLGCLGNHELYTDAEDYTTLQGARLGIWFLRSRARQLRFGSATLNIGGVDYQKMSTTGKYLRGAGKLLVPGAVNVLLSHNPDVFPVAAQQGWDLTLAGHTHGGQVTVEILHRSLNVAKFFTPFVYGSYRSGRSSIYVTRGIGTIAMPTRIGAPPETALLRLRKA